jgi:hypothetical protein
LNILVNQGRHYGIALQPNGGAGPVRGTAGPVRRSRAGPVRRDSALLGGSCWWAAPQLLVGSALDQVDLRPVDSLGVAGLIGRGFGWIGRGRSPVGRRGWGIRRGSGGVGRGRGG